MKRRPRSGKQTPRPAPPPARETALEAGAIGARGDAVAREDGAPETPVFLPYALPGERVRARVAGGRGTILSLERASAERVEPPCPHFGRCGGCQLQHWAEAPYLDWKRDEVVRALGRRGLEAAVAPARAAWGEGRRRATLHAERAGRDVRLGFVERGSSRIEAIGICPVLTPALAAALPGLTELAQHFAPNRGTLTLSLLETEAGIDATLTGAKAPRFDAESLQRVASLADALDLARLTVNGEPLVTRRTPVVTFGRARVTPPPGAFLQATRAGEEALAGLVVGALAGAKRVADLFSGAGTFALRIADFAETHAVEGDAEMLAALKRAADAVGGLRGVTTEIRDLAHNPLIASELEAFDAVVFDPPRAGAREQAEQIAASGLRRAVAVSCDPATFARDARILVDGGFRLTDVTPVDQFRWSAHIEVVGVLER